MSKKTSILLLFIFIKFILHYFLVNPLYDLHRDEYLHLDQAQHLAWGYESVPPFTSWISWIILHLGNSTTLIKFFPVLFGALTIVVVWRTIEVLGGNLFALVMGATAVTFSSLLRINILYQPNSFDILSWTAFYYTIVRFIKSRQNKWLYFAAIAFAAGFLNKYNIVFLLIGMVPALLLTKERSIFVNRHLYFAMAVTAILISANIVWQVQNDFPVIHHMKELAETQLVNVQRRDFLKEQLLFFLNAVYVLIAAFISFFTFPDFKKYRLFFWSYIFTICTFTLLKAKGYYAIGLYPILLAFGSVYIQQLTQTGWKKWLRPLCIVIPAIVFGLIIRIAFPVMSPVRIAQNSGKQTMNRWEDGKLHELPQDFADMLGWRELAAKADSAYSLTNDKAHTLVLCDNYGEAGAVNYYSHENIHAVSFNADYINWFRLTNKILYLVSVKEAGDTVMEHERQAFAMIRQTGSIENAYAREKGARIYLLSSPKKDINVLLEQEIQRRKSSWKY